MSEFIASRIIKEADISLGRGINKYKSYFVNTSLYLKWKEGTDTILEIEGYGDCIVAV